MANNNSISHNTKSNNPFDISIPVSVRFWLYLIPDTLSILCSIFVLYHLLFDRTLRHALHNHVIIVLLFAGLVYETTTVPLMLYYYCVGNSWKRSTSFSRFWIFIDSLSYEIQLIGFAWASIERHILIFHSQWVLTQKKRFFVHYLPLVGVLMYCFIYYFAFDLFPFCGDIDFPSPTNGVPFSCIFFHRIMGKWDAICNLIVPTFIIIIFSLALLFRIIKQSTRFNRSIIWKKQRKVALQLLSISVLYLVFNFPRTILLIMTLSSTFTYVLIPYLSHLVFFALYTIFLFPIVCCGATSGLWKKLKKLVFCRKQRHVVAPAVIPMRNMEHRRIS